MSISRARSDEPRPVDMNSTPNIFVLCGPSGCGKSTLIGRLMSEFPGRFGFSVSHTTRQPRVGEINGVHYNFSEPAKMQADVDAGLFLEHAIVHGNHYGTSFAAIDSVVGNGKICILDIDVQGVETVKRSPKIDQSKVVFVMLVPPSLAELEKRLRGRSTDSEEVIVKRLARARDEMEYRDRKDFWDFILVNDEIDVCYNILKNLVESKFRLGHDLSPKGSKVLGTLSARKPVHPADREADE